MDIRLKEVLVVLFMVLYNPVSGQQFDSNDFLPLENLLREYTERSKIPGLSVAVGYNSKILWSKHFGTADLENNTQVSDSSKFRIASISKLFTGSALYRLHVQKRLNVHDKISKYLDSVPQQWEEITIAQIAKHTSGIGHYRDIPDALDVFHYESTDAALGKIWDRPLEHAPDKGVTYSSLAYTVLAKVIEKTTGKSFKQAMQDLIFEPLGMMNTEPDDQRRIIQNRTGFYQYDLERTIEHAPYIDFSGRWAGSGYLSNAVDLVKFGMAHAYGSDFFKDDELDSLTSPRKIHTGLKSKEGFGWGRRLGWEERMTFWGDGKTPGATCGLLVYPKQKLTIAMVSNVRNAPMERGEFQLLARRLLAIIEGKKIKEIDEGTNSFNLNISLGQNKFEGNLEMVRQENKVKGYFDFKGLQKFEVIDAFWIDRNLWVYALSGGIAPVPLGILPLKFTKTDHGYVGKFFRIDGGFTARNGK